MLVGNWKTTAYCTISANISHSTVHADVVTSSVWVVPLSDMNKVLQTVPLHMAARKSESDVGGSSRCTVMVTTSSVGSSALWNKGTLISRTWFCVTGVQQQGGQDWHFLTAIDQM